MVSFLETFRALLLRAAKAYEGLVELYASSEPADLKWVRNAGEADVYRKGVLENVALPRQEVTAEDTSPFIVSTGHYLDSHWADYTTFPVASPGSKEYPVTDVEKRQRLLQLHAELQAVIDGIGEIYNVLRKP